MVGFSGTPSDFLSNLSRKIKNKHKTALVMLFSKHLVAGLKELQVAVTLEIAKTINNWNNGAMRKSYTRN